MLTDPELDMLMELLDEDPGAEVYIQVGSELVRRNRWVEACEVLSGGLSEDPQTRGWELLARAALESDQPDLSLAALEYLPCNADKDPESCRIRVLALERSGQLEEALSLAKEALETIPGDVILESVLERSEAPPPDPTKCGWLPFYDVRRAELYALHGRPDRAARVYRRILRAHPDDIALQARLTQLAAGHVDAEDDLSEELIDPRTVPPEIAMPSPSIDTPAAPAAFSPPTLDDADRLAAELLDATTQEVIASTKKPGRRKRRRSLISR